MTGTREVERTPTLTPGALAALRRAGFSRRSFLKGTGALIVSFSMEGVLGSALAQGPEGRADRNPVVAEIVRRRATQGHPLLLVRRYSTLRDRSLPHSVGAVAIDILIA